MKDRELTGIGEQFTDYEFHGILDWIIHINDPRQIWKNMPTYLLSEWTYIFFGLCTFIHSQRTGGRFKWVWLATVMHGLFLENVTFWCPQIDNFWHSQTTIMLFGRRLPLHILCLYPSFIYTATVCVSRLRLKSKIAEACAVGLTVVLIDLPYDIMAVKFVHWTWHDTDPNIYDRHYWVPFTSYYFHATFAFSFTIMFHLWRKIFCQNDPQDKWVADARVHRELLCCVLTGLSGMPGGVLQFLPLYHPLHDYFEIHTENCVVTLVVIYFFAAWWCDRNPSKEARNQEGCGFNLIAVALVVHYSLYLSMAFWGTPENHISVGMHEKVGPCDQWDDFPTLITLVNGQTMKRRKFLCTTDYDEAYFDFHCINNKSPQEFAQWYTICGTPFENRAEYIQVISTICLTAIIIFSAMLCHSGREWASPHNMKNKSNKKKNK